eukprot:g15124.t1
MEDLRERFYCTGSTLEVYRQGWSPQDNCGVEPCPEPPIYLPNGFAVTAFAVSYVHKELLDVGSQNGDNLTATLSNSTSNSTDGEGITVGMGAGSTSILTENSTTTAFDAVFLDAAHGAFFSCFLCFMATAWSI